MAFLYRQAERVRPGFEGFRTQRIREEARAAARHARREVLLLGPAFAGVLVAYDHRRHWFPGFGQEVRVLTVIALMVLGYALARDVGRAIGPQLLGRLDPATAGTVGFIIRLLGVLIAFVFALRIAGLPAKSLAVGGAFTAVVVGLAAQQTLGNVIAGTVLLSARPFRVGERVRFTAGALGGQIEGTVAMLGLLYTTISTGSESMLVPNNAILAATVTPLREAAAVDFRARLNPGIRPSDVQRLMDEMVRVPLRHPPDIDLEEVDEEQLVVRITATPMAESDGAALADEILAAVARVTGDEITVEHAAVPRSAAASRN